MATLRKYKSTKARSTKWWAALLWLECFSPVLECVFISPRKGGDSKLIILLWDAWRISSFQFVLKENCFSFPCWAFFLQNWSGSLLGQVRCPARGLNSNPTFPSPVGIGAIDLPFSHSINRFVRWRHSLVQSQSSSDRCVRTFVLSLICGPNMRVGSRLLERDFFWVWFCVFDNLIWMYVMLMERIVQYRNIQYNVI